MTYTCQICDKTKARVTAIKSKLLPVTWLACDECKSLGREPRHAIIIAARGPQGQDLVRPYIKKRLYVGEEIPAADLM